MTPHPTRRTLITTTTGIATTALTGCLGLTNTTDNSTNTTAPGTQTFDDATPFTAVETTGTDLIVQLDEDTNVNQVNLVDPDGTAFAQQPVITGETTIRIQLIDKYDNVIGEDNYTAGTHTLVANTEDETHEVPVELQSKLEVLNVELETDEKADRPTGNLKLIVGNRGTAPTWIYQIAYEGAPYEKANKSLHGNTTWPDLKSPRADAETILPPGQTQAYIGKIPPLRFPDDVEEKCASTPIKFEMRLGSGVGISPRYEVTATPSGNSESIRNHHVCSETTIKYDRVREDVWV